MKTIILLSIIVYLAFIKISIALEISPENTADLNASSTLDETSCLAPELVKDILSDFRLDTDEANKDIRFKRCDPKNIVNKVIRSLAFIKYGTFEKGEKSSDQIYYAEFEKDSAYDFIKRRITTIKLSNCQSTIMLAFATHNNPIINICVDANEYGDKIGAYQSPFYLAQTIVHESRHIDNNDIGHTVCNHGSFMGVNGGCDQSRAQRGAYHFGTDYLVKVAKYGTNFHPAIKELSRTTALFLLTNQFNRVPQIARNKLIFLKKKSGEMIGINEDGAIVLKNKLQPSSIPFERDDESFLIYNPEIKQLRKWGPYIGMAPTDGLLAKEIDKMNSEAFSLIDIQCGKTPGEKAGIIEGQNLLYWFYRPLVKKDNYVTGVLTLPFTPERFLSSDFCHGDANSLYILGKNKQVIQVSMDSLGKISTNEIANCETQFRTVTPFKNSKIGLTTDGRLLIGDENSWKEMELFNEERFTFLSSSMSLLNFFMQP